MTDATDQARTALIDALRGGSSRQLLVLVAESPQAQGQVVSLVESALGEVGYARIVLLGVGPAPSEGFEGIVGSVWMTWDTTGIRAAMRLDPLLLAFVDPVRELRTVEMVLQMVQAGEAVIMVHAERINGRRVTDMAMAETAILNVVCVDAAG